MVLIAKIVKYGNNMNSLNFSEFTANDFDFFFGICSEMQGKGSNEITLSFPYIKKMVNYKETDKSRFIADIERMYDKIDNIVYRYEDDNEIVKFRLFSKFRLLKNEDIVQIKVADEFLPLLNDLKEQFTLFELKQFISLSSKHSKTLFRLCKQWKKTGKTKEYNINDLKNLFDCANYENKNFTRLLKKIVKELNDKEIFKNLDCKPLASDKKGSPIEAYIFTFEPEKVPVKENLASDAEAVQKKPQSKKDTNKFNQFQQNKYDFDQLEKELLAD